jgi:hypothetical protein
MPKCLSGDMIEHEHHPLPSMLLNSRTAERVRKADERRRRQNLYSIYLLEKDAIVRSFIWSAVVGS